MKRTIIAGAALLLMTVGLAACTETGITDAGTEPIVTSYDGKRTVAKVAIAGDCIIYKVTDDDRAFYLASNSGSYGGCSLIEVQPKTP